MLGARVVHARYIFVNFAKLISRGTTWHRHSGLGSERCKADNQMIAELGNL